MKIDAKGRIPPMRRSHYKSRNFFKKATLPIMIMTEGSAYHTRSGIGLGMGLMRHGKLEEPPQLRPRITPIKERGKTQNPQMVSIETIEPNGIARVEVLAMAIKLTNSTTTDRTAGKRPDVTKMRRTQFLPTTSYLKNLLQGIRRKHTSIFRIKGS